MATPPGILNKNTVIAGCGDMGLPMLQTLLAAGVNATGFDIRPVSTYSENNASMVDESALSSADILMVVVRDAAQIDQLCFDQQAVYATEPWPATLIVSSTVSPATIDKLSSRLPEGVTLIDAPMSGAPHAAQNGTLSYMLGGEPHAIKQLMPLFKILGGEINHIGPVGSGMLAKVMNNYVAACSVVAVRRTLARATERGLATDTMLRILTNSSGATWYGNNIDNIAWSEQSYQPGNTIGILEKDVGCALDTVPTPDNFDDALLQALRDLPEFPAD